MPETTTTETMPIVVTDDMRETIGELLDLAFDDAVHWIKYGNPQLDYQSDIDSAEAKAETLRSYAQLAETLGFEGESERWNGLADQFLRAVKGEAEEETE